ncbi:eukaryotic translation initiation factor 2 subunit 3-like isoform X2 [Brachypodium distachyon]|uniref:protein-synthesizing GTPase n=1 Tax=Brachypodium distachyon TaxID=15368 RepID=A0A2K2DG85_BRADI|nr:eukaryotic translation initiation factor 2 subunit 3-like isoform X2 [Brachypodium distachyon]PNT73277.1 hypothetical protein BRADI_2g56414v3 [Brachypodium distachyon]|eukprot:XP_024314378.1 eukaryotic translation initiation factor 2 subunit 3-like isoform X2 [Brachypodium distachyon]
MDIGTQTSPTPRICIGLVGQSATGKSTLLETLLGNEPYGRMEPTLRLKCAYAKIYNCSSSHAECYRSCSRIVDIAEHQCDTPGHELNPVSVQKHVSFVDCPGNMLYVSTMLAGIMMTDGVLVLSKPSVDFYLAPTCAVLAAASIMGKSIVVLQNCTEEESANKTKIKESLRQIQQFTRLIVSIEVPIVRLSVRDKTSSKIAELCSRINNMSTPEQDVTSPALMIIANSTCDPEGSENSDETLLVTIHGRVMQGVISPNQETEVRPGIVKVGEDGKAVSCPIILKVVAIMEDAAVSGQVVALRAAANIRNDDQLKSVIKGGLGGHVLGQVGSLPAVYSALKVKFSLVRKMFNPYSEELEKVEAIEKDQDLLLTIGAMSTHGKVHSITEDMMVVSALTPPSCARKEERIFISRKQELAWNLIGHGEIIGGKSVAVVERSFPAD